MAASRRLLLVGIFTLAAVLLIAGLNIAQQNNLDVQFHAFQDSRGVTVLSPDLSFNKDFSDRTAVRVKFGVPRALAACHTAVVQGYVVEGHVPAASIRRISDLADSASAMEPDTSICTTNSPICGSLSVEGRYTSAKRLLGRRQLTPALINCNMKRSVN